VDGFFSAVERVEGWLRRRPAATVALTVVVFVLDRWISPQHSQPLGWDWLSVSAGVTFALALPFALRLPRRTEDTIQRLVNRGVLSGTGSADLCGEIETSAERWSRVTGPLTAVALLITFLAIFGPRTRPVITLFATVAGFLAGRVIGRMLAVSGLGRRVERGVWMLRVQPGHIDGAAGLDPIGELYFRQAMLLAVPAAWLAVRLTLTSFAMGEWRAVYLGLLAGAVTLEMAAFVAPMLAFHRIMVHEKRRLLLEVDGSSALLHRLEQQLPELTTEAERRAAADQVAGLRERYLRVEQLPTWPVDASIRRRFTVRNVLLLLPAVLNAGGMTLPNTELWERVTQTLGAG
jgi:hypothetical protein